MRLALPLAAAAVAFVTLAGSAGAATPPAPGTVPPDQDPFYTAPADIGSYRPGQIVATRPVVPKLYAAPVTGVGGWQISYRTSDSHGHPELTVTTLLVPERPWTGPGSRPVVSLQSAEDSTGTQCAPSYEVSSGSNPAEIADAFFAAPMLGKGWAVAMPDFEGPKSVFMVGIQAGHAVLDGIRAVRNLGDHGIGPADPWALSGYSGGAEATGWAAELQPSYAPELKITGIAMGGTPADPRAVAAYIDGTVFSGFEAAAAASFDAEYPEAGIRALLNEQGRTDLPKARGKCVADLLTLFPFRRLADESTVPDPMGVPSVAAVLKANTMGRAAPAAPIFDYHANTDELVPVGQDDTLVKAWCARGATVQTVRDATGEHAFEAVVRGGDALAYLADRFTGKKAPSTCQN
jgi:hypothetical protein